MQKSTKNIKFVCEVGEGQFDEILTDQELSYIIEDQCMAEEANAEKLWVYKSVIDDQGPMANTHKDYKGSAYNVLVSWEEG
jgi:hypothetical protein